jgi:hypothetical protein
MVFSFRVVGCRRERHANDGLGRGLIVMMAGHFGLDGMRDAVLAEDAAERVHLACGHDHIGTIGVGGFYADLPSGGQVKHGFGAPRKQ